MRNGIIELQIGAMQNILSDIKKQVANKQNVCVDDEQKVKIGYINTTLEDIEHNMKALEGYIKECKGVM